MKVYTTPPSDIVGCLCAGTGGQGLRVTSQTDNRTYRAIQLQVRLVLHIQEGKQRV